MKRTITWVGMGILLVFLLSHFAPTVAWIGGKRLPIHVTVLDDTTHRAVQGARVEHVPQRIREILDTLTEEDLESLRRIDHGWLSGIGSTDENGHVTVRGDFGAGGGTFLFWRTGRVGVSGPLEIEADGYTPFNGTLQNLLQRKDFPLRTKQVSVTVYLEALRDPTLQQVDDGNAGKPPGDEPTP